MELFIVIIIIIVVVVEMWVCKIRSICFALKRGRKRGQKGGGKKCGCVVDFVLVVVRMFIWVSFDGRFCAHK